MTVHAHWFYAADDRHARLCSCAQMPGGGLRVEEVRVLNITRENQHEHGRPAPIGDSAQPGGAPAHAAPHSISLGREVEEDRHRFAKDIGNWLEGTAARLGATSVVVFACAAMLVILRHLSMQPAGQLVQLEMHPCGLPHLKSSERATHPRIIRQCLPTQQSHF